MHCGNTTFIYHQEFNKYMKVEGATQKMYFIISLILKSENFYQKKKINIYMNYLKSGIQNIFKLRKNLMMDWKTMSKMKTYRISMQMSSLACINYSEKLLHHYVLACKRSTQSTVVMGKNLAIVCVLQPLTYPMQASPL